jgi:hypothetical protein
MINLIPKEEKKKMITGFYLRLLVLFLLMFSFAVFIGSVALLPAYFYSSIKDSVVDMKLQMQKNNAVPASGQESLSAIEDMNGKLTLIENAEKNKFLISEKVIKAILAEKTSDIKIIQITYQNDPILGKTISIFGTASSREDLLSFEQTLQNDPDFKNVNLPISSFVKDTDIQFNLSLSPV